MPEPRILTVFRSRLAVGAYDAGYQARAGEMLGKAKAMPRFVGFNRVRAACGGSIEGGAATE